MRCPGEGLPRGRHERDQVVAALQFVGHVGGVLLMDGLNQHTHLTVMPIAMPSTTPRPSQRQGMDKKARMRRTQGAV
jgi:hypothetical protein